MPSYNTVLTASEYVAEPIKGSRFAAWISPCRSPEEAAAAIATARERWPDASHHCWAWRLADGASRNADDGEPGGSAGRPILAQIDGHEVVDVAVIVARWFGGTKLGVGGLIRAYGGTAGKGLDAASIETVRQTVTVQVEHSYDDTNNVAAALSGQPVEVVDTAWTSVVRVALRVDAEALDDVTTALRDRTSGRCSVELPDANAE